ncbi:hypothetical protein HHI36_019640 [Cryptolaemus montrouzieri]|uniref:Uncharacterized protein n=1 Tax=Cryptolaemus montrouzieri TaxID=559131 RepID=A0ABD2N7Z4_9CUCU
MNPLTILQCINIITQISTNPKDLIGVLSERDGLDFPSIRLNHRIKLPDESTFPRAINFFILDGFNDTQIENIVDIMRPFSWFDPRAKFLIVGTNFSSAMMKYIAKYYVINLTFLDSSCGNITTTCPYKTRSLQKIDTEASLIGYCDESLISMREDDFFPTKIPTNWKKTYLRLAHRNIPVFSRCVLCKNRYKGIESEIFITIFQYLDIRLKAEEFDVGPDTYFEVYNYEIDMIFGVFYQFWVFKSTEVTFPYLQEYVSWFIPMAPEIPRWKYIFHIFHKNVVIAFILTVLAISFLWSFKDYTTQRKTPMKLFFEMVWYPFKLFWDNLVDFIRRV